MYSWQGRPEIIKKDLQQITERARGGARGQAIAPRLSSVLSSGQPAITANHCEWRGWGGGVEERNFLPSPFMPLGATCCARQ